MTKKFTSEDLLKAMGLKVGDKVKCGDTTYTVVDNKIFQDINLVDKFGMFYPLNSLFGCEYTIIQPKPTLTEDEKVILRNLKEYKYVARDSYGKGGNLVLCKEFPERNWVLIGGDGYWLENRNQFPCSTLRIFNHLFQFIKWEDEPYSIKELLGESK